MHAITSSYLYQLDVDFLVVNSKIMATLLRHGMSTGNGSEKKVGIEPKSDEFWVHKWDKQTFTLY